MNNVNHMMMLCNKISSSWEDFSASKDQQAFVENIRLDNLTADELSKNRLYSQWPFGVDQLVS